MDGQVVELEIVDVSEQPGSPWRVPLQKIRSCDGVVVIYSITDRASFHAAREALDAMAEDIQEDDDDDGEGDDDEGESVDIPVLLLANKLDLNHLRKVSYARMTLQ